jgi:chaperonin cofactor prefoldin
MKVWEQWQAKAEKEAEKAKTMTERAVRAEERVKTLESQAKEHELELENMREEIARKKALLLEAHTTLTSLLPSL